MSRDAAGWVGSRRVTFDARKLHWFVVFFVADRWLCGFEAEGWRLVYRDPAGGKLGIVPADDGAPATLEDARWLADAMAFDHDAPIGIQPALHGSWPSQKVADPAAAVQAHQHLDPQDTASVGYYWQSVNTAYGAAAELRFTSSYVIRYDYENTSPSTDFRSRFSGRTELVSLYAMAARQADLLSEYLCLYRILEAADGTNGKRFCASSLPALKTADFGTLLVVDDILEDDEGTNVFETYRTEAVEEVQRLTNLGKDVPKHLHEIRNGLAHGRNNLITHTTRFDDAARALPIVKLLARLTIEPRSPSPAP